MIVDPDFLTHWRTQMLVDSLEDPSAPIYVLRVWSHCQQRKSVRFDRMPPAGLKALCKASGDAQKLEAAMIDAGFVTRVGDAIEVPKWATHNAALIAAWSNGAKGGRTPPKNPTANPSPNPAPKTEPTGIPEQTQDEPMGSPRVAHEQAIGLEEIREEENKKPPNPPQPGGGVLAPLPVAPSPESGAQPAKAKRERKPAQKPESVPVPRSLDTPAFRDAWLSWLADRQIRGKRVTELAASHQLADLEPVGPDRAVECIRESIRNGWAGIFPERTKPDVRGQPFKNARERDADHLLDQTKNFLNPPMPGAEV